MHFSFMQQFPRMLRATSWHLVSLVLAKTFNSFSMPAIHRHNKPQEDFFYKKSAKISAKFPSSPFVDCLIDNCLLQARPDLWSGAASVNPHLSSAYGIHDAVHSPKCSSRQGSGRGCWPASGQAGWRLVSHDAETQLDRRTCLTNGEDISGPVSE